MDEATAFADPDNEARVQAAFAKVANADCIYVIKDGKIAESGKRDALCTKDGLFAKMWADYCSSVQWKVEKEG